MPTLRKQTSVPTSENKVEQACQVSRIERETHALLWPLTPKIDKKSGKYVRKSPK